MPNFKLTIWSALIFIALAIFCLCHIPVTAAVAAGGFAFSLSFLWYNVGKNVVTHQNTDELDYRRIFAQAEQLEEIATSPSIQLFPDIQMESADLAIAKYREIGENERADSLAASFANRMI